MKKVNLILSAIFTLCVLMILSSCQDDEMVNEITDKRPDGEALNGKFSENVNDAVQSFSGNASENFNITGEQGTVVWFGANSFVDADGDSVKGSVDIKLIEIFDKSTMLLHGKSTMARNKNGDKEALISGGEFFINAKQGGEQLFLREGSGFTIMAPADEVDQAMILFTNENADCLDPECDILWKEEDGNKRLEMGDNPAGGGMAYYAFANQFGWTNIDKWYNDPRPKTTLYVDVPEGYDNTNCAVYLSYDGEPTALAVFDQYVDADQLFTEHYGQIPIGMEVHFILVSVIDDEWHYSIQGATITENHIEIMGEPIQTTEAELTNKINNLP